MRKNHRNLTYFAAILMTAPAAQGCLSVDDFVEIIEKPNEEKPDVVIPPGPKPDIPDQGEDSDSSGGSGGLTPGEPTDPELHPGGNPGNVPDEKKLELRAVTPSRGDVMGGYEVRVRGSEFDKTGSVTFGRVKSPVQTYVNGRVVRAVVPPGNLGCVDVTWTQGDERKTIENGFCYFEHVDAQSVTPSKTEQGKVTPISIIGSGFDSNTRVVFVDSSGTSRRIVEPKIVSSTEITGIMPSAAAGAADVVITNAVSKTVLADAVEIVPPIEASGVEPRVIRCGDAPQITVTAKGLTGDTHVKIGGIEPQDLSVKNGEMTFTAPGLTAGSYDILLYDSFRQMRLGNAVHYYEDGAAPKILGIYPNHGPVSGGTEVAAAGIGLPNAGDFLFESSKAVVSARNSVSWTASSPAASSQGWVSVKIGELAAADAFEYINYPTVTAADPENGTPGDEVEVTGTGFGDDLRLFFGDYEASSVTVISAEKAKAVVPPGSGTVVVSAVKKDKKSPSEVTFRYDGPLEITGQSIKEVSEAGGDLIELYGGVFDSSQKLYVDGTETEFAVSASNIIEFVAPAHRDGLVEIKLCAEDGERCVVTGLEYIQPNQVNTSASGGALDGIVNVTVLTVKSGDPIADADVYVGSDVKTALKGKTDAKGQVTIKDPALKGAQTVIACAPKHSCNTLQPVNARDITLFLEPFSKPITPGSGTPTPIPPPPPPKPPKDGGTINPIEIEINYTPKPSYFVGTVGDFGKVELESNPDHIRAGLVMQSALGPYVMPPYKDDVYLLKEPGAEYRIRARRGDVALALVCGVYDVKTHAFEPKYFGIKRHLFANDGDEIRNHLTCDIPLNRTQSIKMLDAPLKSGPNMVAADAFIFVGNEGYIGGFMSGTSDTDLVVVQKIPAMRDELSESSIVFNVGAYTDGNYPATVINSIEAEVGDRTLEVGPAVPIPVFETTPQDDILESGKIAWSVEYPENVDFYELTVRMYSSEIHGDLIHQMYLPGTATTAEFPPTVSWPDDGTGQLFVQLRSYKSVRKGFDFNLFSTAELRYNYIHSSAYSMLTILNPKKRSPQEAQKQESQP